MRHSLAIGIIFGLATIGCKETEPTPATEAKAAAASSATLPAPSAAAPAPATPSELIVLAAASLKGAFVSLEDDFESRNPGADVRFSFAGTQELRRQLESGAKADVFASADEKHMQALLEQKLVATPTVFAENEPVMIVFAESSASLTKFSELPRAPRIVLGVEDVPIGRYSLQILARGNQAYGPTFQKSVEKHVVSRELNVRQVLAKVTLGEADAAIVYHSDVTPPDRKVRVVDIPKEVNVIARYPIAVVSSAPNARLASAWVALVGSPVGHAALDAAGFKPVGGS